MKIILMFLVIIFLKLNNSYSMDTSFVFQGKQYSLEEWKEFEIESIAQLCSRHGSKITTHFLNYKDIVDDVTALLKINRIECDEFVKWFENIVKKNIKIDLRLIEVWLQTKKIDIKPTHLTKVGMMKLVEDVSIKLIGEKEDLTVSISFPRSTDEIIKMTGDKLPLFFVNIRYSNEGEILEAPVIGVSSNVLDIIYKNHGIDGLAYILSQQYCYYLYFKKNYEKNIKRLDYQEEILKIDGMAWDLMKKTGFNNDIIADCLETIYKEFPHLKKDDLRITHMRKQ